MKNKSSIYCFTETDLIHLADYLTDKYSINVFGTNLLSAFKKDIEMKILGYNCKALIIDSILFSCGATDQVLSIIGTVQTVYKIPTFIIINDGSVYTKIRVLANKYNVDCTFIDSELTINVVSYNILYDIFKEEVKDKEFTVNLENYRGA